MFNVLVCKCFKTSTNELKMQLEGSYQNWFLKSMKQKSFPSSQFRILQVYKLVQTHVFKQYGLVPKSTVEILMQSSQHTRGLSTLGFHVEVVKTHKYCAKYSNNIAFPVAVVFGARANSSKQTASCQIIFHPGQLLDPVSSRNHSNGYCKTYLHRL